MHLNSKDIAYTGVMMALVVLLVTLGGYIESSTAFFLAAASFLVGTIKRRFSMGISIVFLAGSLLLGLFLAPQKLYCATFFGFSVYVILAEYLWEKETRGTKPPGRKTVWLVKWAVYQLLIGSLFLLTDRLVGLRYFLKQGLFVWLKDYKVIAGILLFVAAQVIWILFDKAYFFFQERYGKYFRPQD